MPARGGVPGQHYLCAGYKAFFGHVQPAMQAMTNLLRQGRARLSSWLRMRPLTRDAQTTTRAPAAVV